MAKNNVVWIKVQKMGDKVYAEGSCGSDLTEKPTTILNENGPGEWPLADGSKICESDTGDMYFYNETSGWAYMFTFKEDDA